MGKRPRKKIVLFLVEGQSEINALSYAIPQMYESIDEAYEVMFPILRDENQTGGDITSKYGVKPDNIERLISELFVKKTLKDYGLYPKDISEIVHIVDLDGAYISDESIIETKMGSNGRSTYYGENTIETASVDAIMERNSRKRENLNHLSAIETIKIESKSIAYSVYYMSCNLDHFLHGNANIEPYEKCKKADEFTDICISDDSFFENFFMLDNGSTSGMSYEESWDFIKEGNNSLGRHSNLNILIEKIKEAAD